MRLTFGLIDDQLLRSVQLWAQLADTAEYHAALVVMAFVSTTGEPDTEPLLVRLARDGKEVVLPRVDGDGLVAARLGGGPVPGPHGVPEPSGEVVVLAAGDLVVVPGLAFTAAGGRLGHGGGHYDRFLASCPAVTIGVCFAELLVDDLPLVPHDITVDRILTC